MNRSRSRNKTGGGSVKRAVSLPRGLDEEVLKVCKSTRRPYSAVIQVALSKFIARVREAELDRAFRDYYGQKDVRDAEAKLAADMFLSSEEGWPE